MALDKTTVAKIATLARLDIEEDRMEALAGELSGILDWIEQLAEVDTSGVAAMTSVADLALAWREDAVTDGGYADRVLANAPESQDGCFLVPKVVE
ncbi:Asp-tRNA(Asn)/Glu-tRNA(Gln) amidotransferase subunit GatC [Rhodospirillum rubrum]|uniref:Aspartyl/glutamyl-tRNA(Asn/Gln) amidotransferase subunit C n=1 Tax=Rhodospirillum rubrum (strain ATCC 11170 / ATH 1.1.1 / DSM 467 / LMG 4362 / NCIMB 8255 / S1) TaxID=269796 RepID=GATC_RHORT|nr:Asp-tRNA(Asn)/Glu-tRNA(Gln) amidotransferase subunit GatC [Rhodospirillum rubrum]Q2RPH3.1 RecName: Full=Aspartyl/glutamyl-tRNA(Asn/Gln) amidotransferase subunit C; Short=Asp/Glu-ADT subunit C [Rhodospirillum rubrum ATCC 11170]ABC23972.1 aspartyl/glutamyl-tRNA(Asn/Gln) amidotransferase subunit C [Rhodospirillum rubrum ATCC 11170]AEO49717.1 aspartyl/glutamyl-tRNA(Asn/Gln) amidotransferase subunit C [Rhodospirillum rubrum F11]MBK1663445.1 Asp-tRNA(Asn)/Glu-tRNA(Gln) amidotransferase GatCAB subu